MEHTPEKNIFQKIISREIPAEIVYEDDDTLAFLDIAPNNPGHTLVIPKAHYINIFDVTDEVLTRVMQTVRKIAPSVRDAVNADGVNIQSNHGEAAGQVVFHLHIHIIPRFVSDSLEFTWPKQNISAEEQARIAVAIRANIKK